MISSNVNDAEVFEHFKQSIKRNYTLAVLFASEGKQLNRTTKKSKKDK